MFTLDRANRSIVSIEERYSYRQFQKLTLHNNLCYANLVYLWHFSQRALYEK